MDGEPVTGEPSSSEDSELSYNEMFVKVFPKYMAMGMSYDEFWHGPAILAQAYRKAYEIKQRQEEWARWRQGYYNFTALMCAAPVMRAAFSKHKVEPGKFPDEPWPLTEKESNEREQRKARERYYRMREKLIAEVKQTREEKAKESAQKEVSENGRG